MPLLYALLAFAILRLLVVLANALTRQWLRRNEIVGNPKISVLIPARNEERNIAHLVRNIVHVHEIIVYDDQSTDHTIEEVEKIIVPVGASLRAPVINIVKLIRGGELPPGWLGKNYACHRLAEAATGDWLLFLDADVEVSGDLIRDAVGYAQKKNLRMLSLFPQQEMKTAGEWSVVPLMNWILVSLLPLILIRTCRWTSFSGANGQFMLFDATLYRRFHWHEQVKSHPVEDILISRLMKKRRFRTATLLSGGQIRCRMYESYPQALNGFSKNIGQFFGNSLLWMLTFTLLTTLLPLILVSFYLFSFFRLSPFAFFLYLGFILLIRILTSLLSRQNFLKNLLFWLPQQISLILLVWKSIRLRSGGKVEWKGRKI